MKTFLFAILPITLFFSGEYNETEKNYSSRYFPADSGKTLIYASNFGDTKFSVKNEENLYIITNKSEDFDYKQTLEKKGEKYFIIKTEQEVDVFLFLSSSSKVTYNNPALRFPFPLKDGDCWRWKGYEYSDNDSSLITISGKVIGKEEIRVPAGKFECLKIETVIGGTDETKDIVTEWLAKDIGLVKIEAEIGKGGIVGVMQSILGLEVLKFELKEIVLN